MSPRKGSIQHHGAKAAWGSDPDFSQFPNDFVLRPEWALSIGPPPVQKIAKGAAERAHTSQNVTLRVKTYVRPGGTAERHRAGRHTEDFQP